MKLLIDVGGFLLIFNFIKAQIFSIGLQSGDWDGQGNDCMPLLILNVLLISDTYSGSLSSNSF